MANIEFAGQGYAVQSGETVLDCLLRNGVGISHSCKAGVCQSCLVKGGGGAIPERAQNGLKETQRAQGYFLACSCEPVEDLRVALAADDQRVAARIRGLDSLTDTVLRVRLQPVESLGHRAGQYISLFREDGLARSYSVASLPDEDHLELHVRVIPGGAMSQWLREEAAPDTQVWLRGPVGNCFYTRSRPEQPLLLAGTGTGLAPLYGIVKDALAHQHEGPIWLFHGALRPEGLYLTKELRAMSEEHANFHYVPTVLEGEPPAGGKCGTIESAVLSTFPNLEGWRAFVCGDPAFVNGFRKKIFLAGVASKEIHADAFLPSVV